MLNTKKLATNNQTNKTQQSNTVKQQQSNTTKQQNNLNTAKKTKKKSTFKIFEGKRANLSGIYPIMINFNKVMTVLKSKNIELTPKNSFKLIGEYVNRYASKIEDTDEEIVEKNKDMIQLNNNYITILELIKLFSTNNNIITPKSFINCINSLALYYNEKNKKEILLHLSYLAEVIYNHTSKLYDNTGIDRNTFFAKDEGFLDYNTLLECAEFYYTDIYMLNSEERKDLFALLDKYYLEEILDIAQKREKEIAEALQAEKELQEEKERMEKEQAERNLALEKKEAEKKEKEAKNNEKLTKLARAEVEKDRQRKKRSKPASYYR